MNEEQISKKEWTKRIYNIFNGTLMFIGLAFNGIMSLMMLFRGSIFFLLFVVNLWFLFGIRNKRKFRID
jgi:hypothetical protein